MAVEQAESKVHGLGHSRKRVEDARFLRGQGNYIDDFKLPGMLHVDIVRSPYAHAKIKAIHTEKALATPGVLVASHAPFAWGKDVDDSVRNAITLEAVAGMAIDTLAINPQALPVEQYLIDKHYFRKHGKDAYYGQK